MIKILNTLVLLSLSRIALAQVTAIDSRNDFSLGVSNQVCVDCSYGKVTLLPANGIAEDVFDQGVLKAFWTSYLSTTVTPTIGKLTINAASGAPPVGIRSSYLGISSDSDVSVNIFPSGVGSSGTIYFSGDPWSPNYYGVCVTWTGSFTKAILLSYDGFTISSSTAIQIPYLTSTNVRITKVGNIFTAYCNFTPTANTWALISSTAMTLSPANYSIDLGAINSAFGGIADYQNFQVRPYALSGTWESQTIDIGGKPLKAGRVEWSGTIPSGTAMQVQCASSDDGQTWSSYSAALPNSGPFTAPIARYVKFKASLQADSLGNSTPSLDKISLFQDDLAGTLLKTETVKVTPNPARGDKVMLRYGLSEAAQKVSIELYAVSGRLLWRQDGTTQIGENIWNLDASGLASGSYLVRVLAWSDAGGQPTIVTKPFALLR
jgi:hypothetical protein